MLSKKTGANAETTLYYEKIKLIPEPARSSSVYRMYENSHLKRLMFIKRCRELGVKLKEIAALLTLVDGDNYTCGEVRDALTHLKVVDEKIRDLRKMQRTLRSMVSEYESELVSDCPIIEINDQIRVFRIKLFRFGSVFSEVPQFEF